MNTVKTLLTGRPAPAEALRVLTGTTESGKTAIYLSGTPEGFRHMARLLEAQADAAENTTTKLERDEGELHFTTSDSVDVFEMHSHAPAPHHAAVR